MQKQKTRKAGAKLFLGRLRCGFKKGHTKVCVDKGHSRLAPGRALHPPWRFLDCGSSLAQSDGVLNPLANKKNRKKISKTLDKKVRIG